jgi:Zn finger protein HypA/HybF involved in hydrogenase expression
VHELSLALDVCRIAEDTVGREQLSLITEVGLEVGDRSGIEVANFEFCLDALFSSPPFGRARPVIDRLPGDDLRVSYIEVEDGSPPD